MALIPDKASRQEIAADGWRVVRVAQQFFRLMQAERENTESVKALGAEVATLKARVRDLETREEVLLARAEKAGAVAAAQIVTDLARRIGQIEGGGLRGGGDRG